MGVDDITAEAVEGVAHLAREVRDDELRGDFAVNTLGTVWMARAFLRHMLAESVPRGVFVTMSSVMADYPAASMAEYCASKAAIKQLHDCLRWELRAARDVHLLLVQPYAVNTGMIKGAALLGENSTRFAWLKMVLPVLDANVVARRVVSAVETGAEHIYIPWFVGIMSGILLILPAVLRDFIFGICGAGDGMAGFKGCAPPRVPTAATTPLLISPVPSSPLVKRIKSQRGPLALSLLEIDELKEELKPALSSPLHWNIVREAILSTPTSPLSPLRLKTPKRAAAVLQPKSAISLDTGLRQRGTVTQVPATAIERISPATKGWHGIGTDDGNGNGWHLGGTACCGLTDEVAEDLQLSTQELSWIVAVRDAARDASFVVSCVRLVELAIICKGQPYDALSRLRSCVCGVRSTGSTILRLRKHTGGSTSAAPSQAAQCWCPSAAMDARVRALSASVPITLTSCLVR